MRKLFLKGVAAGFVAIALFATPAVAQDVGGAENGGTTSGGATTRAEDDGFDPGWIGLAGLLGLLGLMPRSRDRNDTHTGATTTHR